MISSIYKKTFAVLKKRPVRLWGVSLLCLFLTLAAEIGFAAVPPAAFVVIAALETGMSMIFLNCYRTGLEPRTTYLFSAFTKERFWHVAGGMAWMSLWIFLWSLIPVAGIVFGVMRVYEYRFTPYILMTRPDVSATDAIRVSREETMGSKTRMFWADVLVSLILAAAMFVLWLLARIPFVGVLFWAMLFVLELFTILFLPLFYGVLHAAFYVDIKTARAAPVTPPEQTPAEETPLETPAGEAPAEETPLEAPAGEAPAEEAVPEPEAPAERAEPETPAVCPACGAELEPGARFCTACGMQL